jgi:hypothetical protein
VRHSSVVVAIVSHHPQPIALAHIRFALDYDYRSRCGVLDFDGAGWSISRCLLRSTSGMHMKPTSPADFYFAMSAL